jgi:C4-dicarboxylate-binding protein DctP
VLAEQLTHGRVKVEVYPNSQLYKDKEELEALQLGAVQMLAPSLAKFGPLGVKEFEAFDLPYIFPTKAALYAVTEGPIGKNLLQKLESKGITGLAYWDNGFKVMSANRPLHSRRFPRPAHAHPGFEGARRADARARRGPQVLAFSEVYQALQTRGGRHREPAVEHVHPAMHEVQKHVTVSNHGYLGYAVIVNRKFWDGLPATSAPSWNRRCATPPRSRRRSPSATTTAALEAIRKTGKTHLSIPDAAGTGRLAPYPAARAEAGGSADRQGW